MTACQKRSLSLRDRRGSTLALAIILFLVVSILAMAAAILADGEIRQVVADEKSQEAYYVARSVTETTTRWIQANCSDRDEIAKVVPLETQAGEANAKTITASLDGVPYSLKVWRKADATGTILVETRAQVDGVGNYARMSVDETVSGYLLFDHAIYSRSSIDSKDVNGNAHRIEGSVVSEGSITDEINATSVHPDEPARNYPGVEPPEPLGSPIAGNVSLGNGTTIRGIGIIPAP